MADLIAEDAVIEWPVSGERIVGRADFIAVNSDDGYEDERSVDLLRILADGDLVVTEAEVPRTTWSTGPSPCGRCAKGRSWERGSTGPAPARTRPRAMPAGYVEPLVAD
ncbi:nuclear transport factor 2 family protein [Streptomyces sp. NPDC048269]|uniref:nuclear transport factor 2 family protein n=1 Tax=Streptomyces sp. NPDC048269 TaxID=3155753 RepID=UPI0034330323